MKKRFKLVGILMAMVLATSNIAQPAFATVDGEKKKLKELESQKQTQDNQIANLKKSKAEAEAYIKKIDGQLTEVAGKLQETNQKLDSTEKKIKKNKVKLAAAKESEKKQYSDMKLRIKYMYENGDSQMLDLLFNSENFADFLNKAEYISELSSYDRDMLSKLKKTRKKIADTKKELETQKTELVSLKNEQQTKQAKLEALSSTKQTELSTYKDLIEDSELAAASLDDEIAEQEKRLAAAKAEQQRIAEAQKNAQQQANNTEHAIQNTGEVIAGNPSGKGFVWPLPGHTAVSSNWGDTSGRTSPHNGVDFPAPSGTPIVSVSAGTVVWAERSASAGNWVGVDHGNGIISVYMHMSALGTSTGARVSAGQVIGYVGTTGMSTGNHLHFGVRYNGSWVNPWIYLK